MKPTDCPFCGRKGNEYIFPKLAAPSDPNAFNYTLCRDCRIAYLNPMVEESDNREHYSGFEEGYATAAAAEMQRVEDYKFSTSSKKMIDALKLNKKSDRLLDVGSGKGEAVYCLMKDGWDVFGLDPYFKPKYDDDNLNARLVNRHIEDSGFPDGHFSLITLWSSLEHIPDPAKLFDNIARLLRPGGFLILSCPCIDTFQYKITRQFFPGFGGLGHPYVYSAYGLKKYLAPKGFQLVKRFGNPVYDQWMFKDGLYRIIVTNYREKKHEQLSKNFSKLERSLAGLISFAFVRAEALVGKRATAELVFKKGSSKVQRSKTEHEEKKFKS